MSFSSYELGELGFRAADSPRERNHCHVVREQAFNVVFACLCYCLLSLYDLKAPVEIKTGLPEGEPSFVNQINAINKELFTAIKREKDPRGKFVHILTNRPQNIYYVAVVTRPPSPDPKDFQDYVLKFASEAPMRSVDTFVTRAQELLAKDFHDALVAQLKNDIGFDAVGDMEDARKTFDRDDHGS